MKILFIVDYYQPKLGYGSYYIPKELFKLGHSVTILTSDHYYPFPNYSETAGKILGPRKIKSGITFENGVRVIRKPLLKEIFTRAIFSGHKQLLEAINPEIVMVDKSAGYSAVLISLLKKQFKFKLISIDAHLPSGFEAEGNRFVKNVFYFLFRVFFSRLLNNTVDRFIAVQEETVKMMTQYYGIRKNLVHIPLGTDLNIFKFDLQSRIKLRKKYNIGLKDFVIIYTGKVIKEKGVDILVDAFGVLAKKFTNIKLLIVGSGPDNYEKYCMRNIETKIQKNIFFVGFKPAIELYKFYSASDVAVWPLQESMSMNDAAACRIPFIANNTIGAKFRLSNNNALLYQIGNSKDLAEKIEYLLKKPLVRLNMGKRGEALMKRELSWKRIAQKYIENI